MQRLFLATSGLTSVPTAAVFHICSLGPPVLCSQSCHSSSRNLVARCSSGSLLTSPLTPLPEGCFPSCFYSHHTCCLSDLIHFLTFTPPFGHKSHFQQRFNPGLLSVSFPLSSQLFCRAPILLIFIFCLFNFCCGIFWVFFCLTLKYWGLLPASASPAPGGSLRTMHACFAGKGSKGQSLARQMP